MKYIYILLFSLAFTFTNAQNFDDLSFGTDSTFDVATWNIEHFPKNGTTTINYVSDIIYALDLDYIAMQEVDNPAQFENFIAQLDGYEGFYQENEYARLGVIYKSDLVVNALYQIFTEFQYNSAFSRPPIVMEVEFMDVDYILINNHFKCCGNGILDTNNPNDEEYRRRAASIYLKEYIDANFPENNVMIFGDLNDLITDVAPNNVFQNFLDDPMHYRFVDMDIAESNDTNWSYPSWPSHLDHIMVTDELFDELENADTEVACLKIEQAFSGGWSDYDEDISDHRPVAMRFTPNVFVGVDKIVARNLFITVYPNPVRSGATFQFEKQEEQMDLIVYNTIGQRIQSVRIPAGLGEFHMSFPELSTGIYFAEMRQSGVVIGKLKFLKD